MCLRKGRDRKGLGGYERSLKTANYSEGGAFKKTSIFYMQQLLIISKNENMEKPLYVEEMLVMP